MEVLIKPVVGFEGYYEVDELGNIFGVERTVNKWDGERVIKRSKRGTFLSKHGYERVVLSKQGVNEKHLVHRIVAIAFIPNPDNKRTVNHKNGIKSDNRVENLEWCTSSENQKHSYSMLGTKPYERTKGEVWYKLQGKKSPCLKSVFIYDKNGILRYEFDSISETAMKLNMSIQQVWSYLNKKYKHKGFNFFYNKQ